MFLIYIFMLTMAKEIVVKTYEELVSLDYDVNNN